MLSLEPIHFFVSLCMNGFLMRAVTRVVLSLSVRPATLLLLLVNRLKQRGKRCGTSPSSRIHSKGVERKIVSWNSAHRLDLANIWHRAYCTLLQRNIGDNGYQPVQWMLTLCTILADTEENKYLEHTQESCTEYCGR